MGTIEAAEPKSLGETLKETLLKLGGQRVVPGGGEDLGILLAHAEVFDGTGAVSVPGVPNRCHMNISRLYLSQGGFSICIGYALPHAAVGKVWERHTWGVMP